MSNFCQEHEQNWVRIKRGYGGTDEWRTDGRMAYILAKCLLINSHIRVLSKRIKRGNGPKNVFQPFLVISALYPKGVQKDKTRIWSTFTQT
jgi:hypothetical protein